MNIFTSEILQELFFSHYILSTCILFAFSFVSTYLIIPKVIWVSYKKELTIPVNSRSAHVIPTPSFGGVAFFTTLILMISLLQSMIFQFEGNNLIAGLTILFMVGLKDDLVISTVRVKAIGQLLATAFVVFLPNLQINSLHGFLGINEISPFFAFPFALVIMLSIINAYNLIDGIDGLAGIIGILICSVYATLFYFSNQNFFFLLSISVIAILAAFLRYNLSSGDRKIFMGDSGSLIIGFLIGFLTLRFLTLDKIQFLDYQFITENRLIFVLAILFIPAFDTTRIFITRLLKKQNPFMADRNHAHHILIDLGLSHPQASFLLGFINLAVVFTFLMLGSFYNSFILALVMMGVFIAFSGFFYALKTRKHEIKDFVFEISPEKKALLNPKRKLFANQAVEDASKLS